MKGDFSRLTFKPKNHYSAVLYQQGRPNTDADENEREAIESYRVETETLDVVGAAGAPRVDPGFGLSVDGSGNLVIGEGRFYVDGILCENDEAVTSTTQPDLPDAPTVAAQLDGSTLGLVYLEVFKRHLTFHDRDDMRDPALNGVDTTTRLQTVWQVKVLPLTSVTLTAAALATLKNLATQIAALDTQIAAETDPTTRASLIHQRTALQHQLDVTAAQLGVSCDGSYTEWDALIAPPTGALEVTTIPGGTADEPCDVPPDGGYLRGENQFYIAQVFSVPANSRRNGATFVWSRDDGSIVSRIEAVGNATSGTATGTVFDVNSVQRDEYLGIFTDDWVEYTDDAYELNGLPGVLAKVNNADANLNRITLDRSVTVNLDRNPKLRKWNQADPSATTGSVAMNTTNTPVLLEGGIQLQFSSGTYRPGDYWQFAARAVTGKLDFPAGAQAPFGIQRHFARLGIVALSGGVLQMLLDCRTVFPPLTAITASDVSFDNTTCNFPDAVTVQDALDQLCERSGGGGTCTLTVSPGAGWWDIFDQIPQGGDAEICFPVGDYQIDQSIIVAAKGNLKLTGAGFGTHLLALKSENALTFQKCNSVIVRDLSVTTGVAGSGEGEKSLQGSLTFENCPLVILDTLFLRCASDVIRSAACLRVINDGELADIMAGRGLVDVQNCCFHVGSSQIGAIIINGARVQLENNLIEVVDTRSANQRIGRGLGSKTGLRAELRRVILADVQEGRVNSEGRENLQIGNITVNFRSDPRLTEIKFFAQLLRLFSPEKVSDLPSAEQYLQDSVDALLLKPDTISAFVPYFERMVAEDVAALYQGIVIGGEEAEEVRIVNNTIINALQGIHIGQSRRGAPRAERLKSTVVSIKGNTIYSRLPPAINREAYGILVGNCDSLFIENNVLTKEALKSTVFLPMDGIHIAGALGKRMIVRHNETENYRFGVFVDPQSALNQPLWMVVDNVATVHPTDARVQVANNLP